MNSSFHQRGKWRENFQKRKQSKNVKFRPILTYFIEATVLIKDFDQENKGSRHKFISENGKYIYHVALIDYLQAYNLEK